MENNPYAAPQVDPTPSPESHAQGEGPREWSVGAALNVGIEAVKKNPGVLIGGYLVVIILQQIIQSGINYALVGSVEQSADPLAALRNAGTTAPVSMVIGVFFTIGQMRVALAAARDEPIDFGLFFSGFDRLLPGILLMVLMYLGIIAGTILLIVPGVIVALAWSMSFASLADTKMGTLELLSDSWEATKGHKFAILIFGFASIGVFLLGVLALFVGIFVAYPIVMVAFAEIYMCITGRRTAEA
jgi:TM2 domain-containing membrane protein YozV